MVVSIATGDENYKFQCLSTFLSNEFTTKPKNVDIILKQFFLLFCTVVSGCTVADSRRGNGETVESWNSCTVPTEGTREAGEEMETWNSCTVARNRRDNGDMEQLYNARNRRDNGDMEQLYSCQEQERHWRHGTVVQLPGTGETVETWNSCTVARRVRMMGERFCRQNLAPCRRVTVTGF